MRPRLPVPRDCVAADWYLATAAWLSRGAPGPRYAASHALPAVRRQRSAGRAAVRRRDGHCRHALPSSARTTISSPSASTAATRVRVALRAALREARAARSVASPRPSPTPTFSDSYLRALEPNCRPPRLGGQWWPTRTWRYCGECERDAWPMGACLGREVPPYVIAEIGANHNGDMALCRRLIDAAEAAGADAVKFQSWSASSLISEAEYERQTELLRHEEARGFAARDGRALPAQAEPAPRGGCPLPVSTRLPLDAVQPGGGRPARRPRRAGHQGGFDGRRATCRCSSTSAARAAGAALDGHGDARPRSRGASKRCGPPARATSSSCTASPSIRPSRRRSTCATWPTLQAAFGAPVGFSDHTVGMAISAGRGRPGSLRAREALHARQGHGGLGPCHLRRPARAGHHLCRQQGRLGRAGFARTHGDRGRARQAAAVPAPRRPAPCGHGRPDADRR